MKKRKERREKESRNRQKKKHVFIYITRSYEHSSYAGLSIDELPLFPRPIYNRARSSSLTNRLWLRWSENDIECSQAATSSSFFSLSFFLYFFATFASFFSIIYEQKDWRRKGEKFLRRTGCLLLDSRVRGYGLGFFLIFFICGDETNHLHNWRNKRKSTPWHVYQQIFEIDLYEWICHTHTDVHAIYIYD